MKHRTFLKNAALLSLGGLAAKAVGALYRIPLANLLGSTGEGLYHMAYPLFCLMLTLSSSGVATVVARAVAAERAAGGRGIRRTALLVFAGLGAFATLLMCLLALPVAQLQGEAGLVGCYLALAPAVLPVALLSVLRGACVGEGDAVRPALSELVEQLSKAAFGLLLASRYPHDPVQAARAALFAVALSEGVALLFLFPRSPRRRVSLLRRRGQGGALLAAAFPVMANAALLPLSQMADSVLVVRLLSRHTARAVSLYGLFAGSVVTLVSLPATLCAGLMSAAVPAVAAAAARGDGAEGRRRALFALGATLALALPCALGLFLLAPTAVSWLLPALPAADRALAVRLVRLMAVSAATLAAVDTLAACLAALGRAKCAARSMLLAVLVKAALQWAFVGNPAVGIAGAAIASNACYLVAFLLDFGYTIHKKPERRHDQHHRIGNEKGRAHAGRAGRAAYGRRRVRAHGDPPLGGGLEGGGDRL